MCGCPSTATLEARRLAAAREHQRALTAWQRRLVEAPDDAEALEGKRVASDGLLAERVRAAERLRTSGELNAALAMLVEAREFEPSSSGPSRAIADEQGHLRDGVLRRHTELLAVGQPLAAARFARPLERPLHDVGLDGLAERMREARAVVVGRRCLALERAVRTPWLARAAARYCAALERPWPQPNAAPEQRGSLEVDVEAVVTTSTGFGPKAREAVQAVFAGMPWYAPGAPGAVAGRLTGSIDGHLDEAPVELTVTWQQIETYTTSELVTESYVESYMASETYSYSCGTGTQYRTCTGTRPVTRTRPATRLVNKSVTRTRPVARSTTYPATQKSANHRVDLSLAVALPGTPRALVVELVERYEKSDFAHQTTFAPAGLKPKRAEVLSPDEWESRQLAALEERLGGALEKSWVDTFCAEADPSPEQAARCLAGKGASPAALLVLARYLGEAPTDLEGLWR